MSDIVQTGASGYQLGEIDTATTVVDAPATNKTPVAARIPNGCTSAIVQIETILGVGPDLKGTKADLATRLAVRHNADGTHTTALVTEGGTGITSHSAGGVLVGQGTNTLSNTGPGTVGAVLTGNGSDIPLWAYGLVYHGPSGVGGGATRSYEGSPSISGSYYGVHFFDTVLIDSGNTVTVPAGKRRLIIIAKTSITVNGTIAAQGAGGTSDTHGTDQAGGGGAKGTANGNNGGSVLVHGITLQSGGAGGTSGNGSSGSGLTGSDVPFLAQFLTVMGGAGGGSGGDAGTNGGAGGASVVLIAPLIVLTGAVINTSGANGSNGGGGVGSGGGGGAGNIYMICKTHVTGSVTFTQTGGTGGSGGAGNIGGNGANGVSQILIYG